MSSPRAKRATKEGKAEGRNGQNEEVQEWEEQFGSLSDLDCDSVFCTLASFGTYWHHFTFNIPRASGRNLTSANLLNTVMKTPSCAMSLIQSGEYQTLSRKLGYN